MVGSVETSPSHQLLAWSEDTTGNEHYTIRVKVTQQISLRDQVQLHRVWSPCFACQQMSLQQRYIFEKNLIKWMYKNTILSISCLKCRTLPQTRKSWILFRIPVEILCGLETISTYSLSQKILRRGNTTSNLHSVNSVEVLNLVVLSGLTRYGDE
jgi:hypothetical protein